MKLNRRVYIVATLFLALFLITANAYAANLDLFVSGDIGGTILGCIDDDNDPATPTPSTSCSSTELKGFTKNDTVEFTLTTNSYFQAVSLFRTGSAPRFDQEYLDVNNLDDYLDVGCSAAPVPGEVAVVEVTCRVTDFNDDFNIEATFAPIPVEANFSVSPTSGGGEATYPIQFTDASINGADSWTWDFGDETTISGTTPEKQNPVHTYAVPGTYTVKLTAANTLNGTSSISSISYTVIQPTITYQTSVDPEGPNGSITPSGDESGKVVVNEGSSTTFTITPNEYYQVADVRVDDSSVCVDVPEVNCEEITSVIFDSTDKADHSITASFEPIPVVASFNGPSGEITTTDEVTFSAVTSQGNLTFWEWYINDETEPIGEAQDLVLTFADAGPYTVTLVVGNAAISSTYSESYTVDPSSSASRVMNESTLQEYEYLQDAYDESVDNETIKMKASAPVEENLVFDRDVIVILEGGYEDDFTGGNGFSRVHGNILIRNGTVKVSKVIVASIVPVP